MRAIAQDRFGPIDVLHPAEAAVPQIGKGQVLVAVRATSINAIDSRVGNGMMGPLVNKKLPKVQGSDVAGIVTLSKAVSPPDTWPFRRTGSRSCPRT